ncbi:MAG: tetratricopeptide repeat protein [Chloroflexota bacterium]
MKPRLIMLFLGLILVMSLAVACIPESPEPTPTAMSGNSEDFVVCAWDALGKEKFDRAIECAQQCTDAFEGVAFAQQDALTEAPPVGAVSDEENTAIHANWALNDVATSYFIMGKALVELGRVDEAKEAYQGAIELPYGRTWDPQGWFWSPAETASEELNKMP